MRVTAESIRKIKDIVLRDRAAMVPLARPNKIKGIPVVMKEELVRETHRARCSTAMPDLIYLEDLSRRWSCTKLRFRASLDG